MKMKNLTLMPVFFMWAQVNAQTLESSNNTMQYTASSGVTYRIGNIIYPNKGSGRNGSFRFIYWANLVLGEANTSSRIGENNFILKKIKTIDDFGKKKIVFVVNTNDLVGHEYSILIEDAISACEVKPCESTSNNKQKKTLA